MQLQLKKKKNGTLETQTRSKTSSINGVKPLSLIQCFVVFFYRREISLSGGYCCQKADGNVTQILPTSGCLKEAYNHFLTRCAHYVLALMRTLRFPCELVALMGGVWEPPLIQCCLSKHFPVVSNLGDGGAVALQFLGPPWVADDFLLRYRSSHLTGALQGQEPYLTFTTVSPEICRAWHILVKPVKHLPV